MPPDDPTLALLATAVVDLLGLTELLVEAPEDWLVVDVVLDVADLLTELETADAVVLLAALKVAVFEAVAVLADFAAAAAAAVFAAAAAAAALAAACCWASKAAAEAFWAAVSVTANALEPIAPMKATSNAADINEIGLMIAPSAN
ncbi:hypothetical protein G6727_02110 [Polynucleobacter paneuropaeus]|nr:hypothetical protein [Polynucleobacter paneuropaeus]